MRIPLIVATSLFLGCSFFTQQPAAVRQGDTVAAVGDWEAALVQYRAAARENPNDLSLKKKIAEAEEKCAEIWTRRAEEANKEGNVTAAADLWRKALEVTPEDTRKSSPAWSAATSNLSALEYAAESAASEGRNMDALSTFSLLAIVQPDRAGIGERVLDAKRRVALEYVQESDTHWRKELAGASLIANMKALQFDPMQEKAFANANELRKVLRKRSRVAIEGPVVEAAGHKSIRPVIQTKLSPRLGDYPPYGRWKEAPQKATFKATIEAFTKDEIVEEGVDEMPNTAAPPTDPIPNPAIKEQEAKIDRLEKKLADLQAKMKAELDKKKKRGAPAKKKPGSAPDPGLELARELDKTRMDVASAKARLEQLPATIVPPPPDPTWKLPWTKTIRWAQARVRFEIREPNFAEPIVIVSEHKIEKSDRTHKGNEKQSVDPDPLQVPSYDDILGELGDKLAADGITALEKARARRIEGIFEEGRRNEKGGASAEATDAYVQLLFLVGIEKLPPEAAAYLARNVENERLDAILGKKDD